MGGFQARHHLVIIARAEDPAAGQAQPAFQPGLYVIIRRKRFRFGSKECRKLRKTQYPCGFCGFFNYCRIRFRTTGWTKVAVLKSVNPEKWHKNKIVQVRQKNTAGFVKTFVLTVHLNWIRLESRKRFSDFETIAGQNTKSFIKQKGGKT